MIKESGGFMEGKCSWYIPNLSKLMVIGIVLMDMKLFYLIRPRFYTAMLSYGKKSVKVGHHPVTIYDHNHCDSTRCNVLFCHVVSQKVRAYRSFDLMGKRQ